MKEVIDHRPIDPTMSWDKTKVDVKIEEVGSCSTLIADKIFETGKEDLIKELAYLIYGKYVKHLWMYSFISLKCSFNI